MTGRRVSTDVMVGLGPRICDPESCEVLREVASIVRVWVSVLRAAHLGFQVNVVPGDGVLDPSGEGSAHREQ